MSPRPFGLNTDSATPKDCLCISLSGNFLLRGSLANFQKQSSVVFCEKGVLRNFAKFTGKQLCQPLFFIKKETLVLVFDCEFCKISKKTFFTERLWVTAFNIQHSTLNTETFNTLTLEI